MRELSQVAGLDSSGGLCRQMTIKLVCLQLHKTNKKLKQLVFLLFFYYILESTT